MPDSLIIDAFRLRQVLLNLLGNAVKFTEHGTVILEVRWDMSGLAITVRDTGIGIPADSLQRVFEPYQRAVGGRVAGTGLGLTITRKLVELMGGSIRVTSVPDGGTTFEVKIRAPLGKAATREVTRAHAGVPEPLGGKLLIAEDNASLRELLALWMRDLRVDYKIVGNGLDAVEAALGEDFDAVLMDMEMPLMDGHEAVRVLRERGYTKPIIAFSAHEQGPELQRAIQGGCDGSVAKPTTIDRLREALAPVLAGAKAHAA
jgi:CheY-like chemotaxis protein/anti-sigma regulatory factor (Ser/Thr protein kinase)